jgi:hypothetical protein
MIRPELQFQHDTKLMEMLFSRPLDKTAQGGASSLIESIKHYVQNHINEDNPVESLVNLLAPGVIARVIGGGWGLLLGLALNVFHVDVYGIFSSIWNRLRPQLSDDQKVSSRQIKDAVQGAVEEHTGNIQATSMEDAKRWKLVLLAYDAEIRNTKVTQRWGRRSKIEDMFSGLLGGNRYGRPGIGGLLVKVLSWIFGVALASAGLVVAGDMLNKAIGRPSALDDTIQKGKPIEKETPEPETPICHSSQTKFPLRPDYHEEGHNAPNQSWIERYPNTNAGIANMLLDFVKAVYGGLEGKEGQVKSVPSFQAQINEIAWYNHAAAGDPIVFLPRHFKSKKSVVDCFIDEVANAIK